MSLSRGFVIEELGASNDLNWDPHNIFRKTISSTTTFTFSNLNDKIAIFIVNNTSGSDVFCNFPSMLNYNTIDRRVRGGTTSIFLFAHANGELFCIAPVRSEATYA